MDIAKYKVLNLEVFLRWAQSSQDGHAHQLDVFSAQADRRLGPVPTLCLVEFGSALNVFPYSLSASVLAAEIASLEFGAPARPSAVGLLIDRLERGGGPVLGGKNTGILWEGLLTVSRLFLRADLARTIDLLLGQEQEALGAEDPERQVHFSDFLEFLDAESEEARNVKTPRALRDAYAAALDRVLELDQALSLWDMLEHRLPPSWSHSAAVLEFAEDCLFKSKEVKLRVRDVLLRVQEEQVSPLVEAQEGFLFAEEANDVEFIDHGDIELDTEVF